MDVMVIRELSILVISKITVMKEIKILNTLPNISDVTDIPVIRASPSWTSQHQGIQEITDISDKCSYLFRY